MAGLFDRLPYRACCAIPYLGTLACLGLVNPSLGIPFPILLVSCGLCVYLNVKLADEHETKYGKDLDVAVFGSVFPVAIIFLWALFLFVEVDSKGNRPAAVYAYGIFAPAVLVGLAVYFTFSGGHAIPEEPTS